MTVALPQEGTVTNFSYGRVTHHETAWNSASRFSQFGPSVSLCDLGQAHFPLWASAYNGLGEALWFPICKDLEPPLGPTHRPKALTHSLTNGSE